MLLLISYGGEIKSLELALNHPATKSIELQQQHYQNVLCKLFTAPICFTNKQTKYSFKVKKGQLI